MRSFPLLLLVVLVAAGCGASNRLAEYDFRDRTLAVVSDIPPYPDVFHDDLWLAGGDEKGLIATVLSVGAAIAKDVNAEQARARLDSAARMVDVSELLAHRVQDRALTMLRVQPTDDDRTADFVFEVQIREYGIEAASWNARAYFKVNAMVYLLDGQTGERIWRGKVEERDAITPNTFGLGSTIGNIVTADALARLSVEEMARALESLAVYAADQITYKLRRDYDRARK